MRKPTEPGRLTRSQLLQLIGITATELDTLDRQDICRPIQRRTAGDTRPVEYDHIEAGLIRLARNAATLGVRGKKLAEIIALIRARSGRLTPGWTGTILYDGTGVDLLPHGADPAAWLSPTTNQPVLLLPLQIPTIDTVRDG